MSFRPLTIPAILFAGFSFASGVNAATMTMDTLQPNDLTIMLKNFNVVGATDHSSIASNVTPTLTFSPTGNQNGFGRYTTQAGTSDPRVEFYNSTAPANPIVNTPYDVNIYGYVRIRQRASTAGSVEFWPNRAVNGNTMLNFSTTTTFTEESKAWKNPGDANIQTQTVGGFRWDPPNTTAANYDLDYVMVDRGRVKGFEFDVSEGLASDFQGLTFNPQFSSSSVSNGNLIGTTNDVDSRIFLSSLGLSASIYKYVEIRMKVDAGQTLQFFWDTAGNFTEGQSLKPALSDGLWHTYMLDFTNEASWAGTMNNFRIDPSTQANINFEIDYIRFREIGAVPEPGRFALLALAGMGFILRRRRKA